MDSKKEEIGFCGLGSMGSGKCNKSLQSTRKDSRLADMIHTRGWQEWRGTCSLRCKRAVTKHYLSGTATRPKQRLSLRRAQRLCRVSKVRDLEILRSSPLSQYTNQWFEKISNESCRVLLQRLLQSATLSWSCSPTTMPCGQSLAPTSRLQKGLMGLYSLTVALLLQN